MNQISPVFWLYFLVFCKYKALIYYVFGYIDFYLISGKTLCFVHQPLRQQPPASEPESAHCITLRLIFISALQCEYCPALRHGQHNYS